MRTPSLAVLTIDAARERRRLGKDLLTAFAIKLIAIVALALLFFGADHRPNFDPATLFSPTKSIAQLKG
jgi:hypothetical protein